MRAFPVSGCRKTASSTYTGVSTIHAHDRTFPTGAAGMQACAASASASPARRIDTTHTLLSSTYTLENVAAVGVVMNCREDSRHAIPFFWGGEGRQKNKQKRDENRPQNKAEKEIRRAARNATASVRGASTRQTCLTGVLPAAAVREGTS